ncbi:MAG: helix-turn-helix domain-containing protein [Deltaproteobacteria bacterium]|nr:helix-turn-helix domain-containing protein [Deltaproteobacteria bacterium]
MRPRVARVRAASRVDAGLGDKCPRENRRSSHSRKVEGAQGRPVRARLLTAKDVAARLGVSRSYAYEVMSAMPGAVYLGRRCIRVSEEALDAWIATRTVRSDACEQRSPTSSFGAPRGGSASGTTVVGASARARASATERWLSRLRDSSSTSTSPPQRGSRARR